MADLSQKATDGRTSFVKYVTENKRFREIDYEIERGRKTPIFIKSGRNLVASKKEYGEGTKLKITEAKMIEFSDMKLAAVKIGTVAGFIPIKMIRKPTGGNGTQYEDEVVDSINKFILEAGGPIDIKLKGDSKTYKGILYAIKVDSAIKAKAGVRGDPKADIILCKDKDNPTAAGSIYVSHKKEGGPEAFQQYGGLSQQAGEAIYNHKLTQKFLAKVAEAIGKGSQLPYPVMAHFKDDTLSNMAIYGPDYGRAFSLQHTQIIGQGLSRFRNVSNGKYYELDFTSHMSLSGDLSHFTGGYLPVFGATFRAGRGFDYKGTRYNGARVAIYPHKLMATRGGLVEFNFK
jgi:hypothetical protein